MKEQLDVNKQIFVAIRVMTSGKWRLPILWHIASGDNRFSILKKSIGQISEKMLYKEIEELEKIGIITKVIIDDIPPKHIEYHINENREELISIINCLYDFVRIELEENNYRLEMVIGENIVK